LTATDCTQQCSLALVISSQSVFEKGWVGSATYSVAPQMRDTFALTLHTLYDRIALVKKKGGQRDEDGKEPS